MFLQSIGHAILSVHAELVTVFAVLHTTQMHICMSGAQLEFGLLPFSVSQHMHM